MTPALDPASHEYVHWQSEGFRSRRFLQARFAVPERWLRQVGVSRDGGVRRRRNGHHHAHRPHCPGEPETEANETGEASAEIDTLPPLGLWGGGLPTPLRHSFRQICWIDHDLDEGQPVRALFDTSQDIGQLGLGAGGMHREGSLRSKHRW